MTEPIENDKEYNLEFAINPADGSDQKVIISIAGLEKNAQGNTIRVIGVIQGLSQVVSSYRFLTLFSQEIKWIKIAQKTVRNRIGTNKSMLL
ncbi:hypothetical protein [Methanoregula sp.]|uniref:hypothetical protein n=1 Tax=Methanoregula sp. TaxID=2052170 RepID=UPI0025F39839|nr:hypothetical protein [Methanoregula sp.]